MGIYHQEFQVPKMEVLNLIKRLFWGWVFPYISHIHTAYIGEYLHFRYLKSLVNVGEFHGNLRVLGGWAPRTDGYVVNNHEKVFVP